MTTTIILDGPMGKKFGKKWKLHVSSPAEALRMIEANRSGLFAWIRDNLETYENYQVVCKYANGNTEIIGEDELSINGDIDSVRFTPLVAGSGNVVKIIAGAVLVVIGIVVGVLTGWTGVGLFAAGGLISMGLGMMVGGVVGMLTPQPKFGIGQDAQERVDKTSHYFNGPVNTTMQGVGVPLIYGKCLVGSHTISASVTVDDVVA